MAAANYTPLSLYYSSTAATTPVAGNLVNGELAINITDGKLYYKDNTGTVQVLATKASVTNVSSLSFDATGLTPTTATTGDIVVGGTLLPSHGGTGITSLGTSVATALGVNVGTAGSFVVNGNSLGTPSSGVLTNVTGLPLTTGVTGILPIANGGTGNTTSNAASATKLATARNIQGVSFDGTSDITVATAGTGISVTGTSIANTGVTSFNGATGATTGVDLTTNQTIAGNKTFTGNMSGVIKSGTAVSASANTSFDFTGIPSTAKRVTVVFQGISTSGSNHILVQIGSGSVTTSGYLSYSAQTGGSGSSGNGTSSTAGFIILVFNASDTKHGAMTLDNISGNGWISSQSLGGIYPSGNAGYSGGGSITLSGVLDRVRITTVNGTDTFDAGSVNVLWI